MALSDGTLVENAWQAFGTRYCYYARPPRGRAGRYPCQGDDKGSEALPGLNVNGGVIAAKIDGSHAQRVKSVTFHAPSAARRVASGWSSRWVTGDAGLLSERGKDRNSDQQPSSRAIYRFRRLFPESPLASPTALPSVNHHAVTSTGRTPRTTWRRPKTAGFRRGTMVLSELRRQS